MEQGIRQTLVGLAVALALTGAVGGCASSGSTDAAATTVAETTLPAGSDPSAPPDTLAPPEIVDTDTATIQATDNDYAPKHLQITAGTVVTFVNKGRNQHDVIATDPARGDFTIAQEDFEPGVSVERTFDEPGTYPYFCSLHATATAGSMRGYITVTAP